MVSSQDPLVHFALSHGLLTPARLAAAQPDGDGTGDRRSKLVESLIREGLLDGRRLAAALSTHFGLPLIDPATAEASAEALALVPRTLAERASVLPLSRDGSTLRVAVADPFDFVALDALGHATGLAVEPAVAPADVLRGAIERRYAAQPSGPAAGSPEAPVIRLVEGLLQKAVARRASDVHFEPLADRMRVRCRIDGVLHEMPGPPPQWRMPVISRLKLMAGISIAEKRRPQDGRARLALGGRNVDLRVSSLPTVHGESVVLRVLEPERVHRDVAELGLADDHQRILEKLLALNGGLILVTGPTGSGKTTTLYACLHRLNRADRKIITVEDPVEYRLTGINQVTVRSAVGLTFAAALRAMLRQAPNVIMVGEIRDRETADIAINAALTGHLVFSTLHTNDCVEAVTRLADIGVKPFLIASALRAVVAQRLVRRLCRGCGGREGGCPACDFTGYRGRLGLFEILTIDAEAERAIGAAAGPAQRRVLERIRGPVTLREDGRRKAAAGVTSLAEVLAATVDDANER